LFVSGSPADKADLEIGDEILEVNGRNLEDANHTEILSHIHQVSLSLVSSYFSLQRPFHNDWEKYHSREWILDGRKLGTFFGC